jgi:dihydroflavonol-4-reductase
MIFVTGGTGLLGSHLLLELAGSSKKIRALKRNSGDTGKVLKVFSYHVPNPEELFRKIEWAEGDLLDSGSLEDALEGVTEIYHAGAIVSFSRGDHKIMLKVNTEGTANLVNLALEKKVEKFCFVSSIATLGRAENGKLTDEETHWIISGKNSVYSISKYGAEREVWRGIEEGLNAVIVNPSVILGPGFWNGSSGLFRLAWEGLKFYTLGVNGYVDVRDVAKVMTQVMNRNLFGQRYILSSENVTYQQFFTYIANYFNKPAPSINVPPVLSHIAWRYEALRCFLTNRQPEITKEMANTSVQKYRYNNEKIRKALGYQFIPVEDSIRDTCRIFLRDLNQ